MIRFFAAFLALVFAGHAGASRLDEIGERIELLGSSLADAYLAACVDELPSASEHLRELRATSAARDELKSRCEAAYGAWSRSAARLDETGDFAEVERLQRELLPCWDEIEAMQAEVKALARRCLALMRLGRDPIFPFGLGELDTRIDLSEEIACERRDLCHLRPEALAARDPGWIGRGARQVSLGFSRMGIDQVLTSVFVSRTHPSCEAAGFRLKVWSQMLEARWPEALWQGDLPDDCGPAARVAAVGDHLVVLMAFDQGPEFLAAVLVVHNPWRLLREHSFPH